MRSAPRSRPSTTTNAHRLGSTRARKKCVRLERRLGVKDRRGQLEPGSSWRKRPTSAGDEFGEGILRLGAPDDVRRVMPLLGPLLLEVLPHMFEQQRLDAHY